MVRRAELSARSASRSGLTAYQVGRNFVPALNIIKIAKAGLKGAEYGDERLVSLTMLAISRKTRKEVARVS
jgi:hypothetical protein